MISLTGRSPHAAMNTERRSRSATLPLRSFSSLAVMNASAAMVKECLIRSARSRASAARRSASTTAGSMPRATCERHSPAMRRASSSLIASAP